VSDFCGHVCCEQRDNPKHGHAILPETCDGCVSITADEPVLAVHADHRFDHYGTWPPEIEPEGCPGPEEAGRAGATSPAQDDPGGLTSEQSVAGEDL
jgi:hypothetical protein